MLMARKRKSSSPEPRLARSEALKKDEDVFEIKASRSASLDSQRICPFAKRKRQRIVSDASPQRGHSARFKGQVECREESQPSTSPAQHPASPKDDSDLGLVITLGENQCGGQQGWRKKGVRMKMGAAGGTEAAGPRAEQEEMACEDPDINRQLDKELERKSQQHNLSRSNVRSILHEVITNKHVVAMMKAAIRETQDMPLFEPKMTRSRLKEVVQKGVVIPTWNIPAIKKANEVKPPQFVDIQLEEEDSSDEEYCPDEEEEDETAEETFLESDVESTASSPRGSRPGRSRTPVDSAAQGECRGGSPRQKSRLSRHLRVEVVPMGPPPPPQSAGPQRPVRVPHECSFMEKLHAVDEELALSPICMEPYQALSGGGGGGESLVACRTRSKRPLRNVPLGQLEAELHAPDITPDMYECGSAPEDHEWTKWLQGLMRSDMENEEEGDDDDDPEYNFLEDIDEPDLEDYRNDRAVRITKKEVNELMEELFETFQDELGVQKHDEEGHEEEEEEDREEEAPSQGAPNFNVPQAIRFEEPLANMLTERHRLAKEQLEALQQRRALMDVQAKSSQSPPQPPVLLLPPPCVLILTPLQKLQLQQQLQQHVQLLTQVHILCSPVEALQSELAVVQHFLEELKVFSERGEQSRRPVEPGFVSIFRTCNLQGALSLLHELKHSDIPVLPVQPFRRNSFRSYPLLPPNVAWLLATRPVFMYPQLLPHCSLDPALHPPRSNKGYTRGEECLIVLGLKHFGETEFPYQLMCRYLLRTKNPQQLRARVHDMSARRAPDNIIKFFCQHKIVPSMLLGCGRVMPGEERPAVEREETILPIWLRKSFPYIHKAVLKYNQPEGQVPADVVQSPPYVFPPGTRYPASLPRDVTLRLHPGGFKATGSHAGSKPPAQSLPALTKAPAGLTAATPFLAKTSGTTPNHGVILMAKAPTTPIHGAVSLGQAPLTPAHGTVPVNTPYSVSLSTAQCFAQTPVMQDLPSAPHSSLLQVSSTAPLVAPRHTNKRRANQRPPRKLLPIQPAPPKLPSQPLPLLTISTGGTVNVLNLASGSAVVAEDTGGGACGVIPSTVIINLATPVGTTVVCPPPAAEGLVSPSPEATPLPQDPVTHPNGALAQLRKLARPLLPAPPSTNPSQSYTDTDSAVKLKLNPIFLHTPSPAVTSSDHVTNTTPLHTVSLENPREMSMDTSPCDPQKSKGTCYGSSPQTMNTFEHNVQCFKTVTPSGQIQSEVPNHDQGTAPRGILLDTASQQNLQQTNDTENTKNHILPFSELGPPLACSPMTTTSVNLPDTSTGTDQQQPSKVPFINMLNSRDVIRFGSSVKPSTSSVAQLEVDGLVASTGEQKEQEEHHEREEWGESESGNIAGRLLALSESSSSPRSSLDSHADALERLMDVEEEGKLVEAGWCRLAASTPRLPSEAEETGDEDDWDDEAKPRNGPAGGQASDAEVGTQRKVEEEDGRLEDGDSGRACVNLPPPHVKLAEGKCISVGGLSLSSAHEGQEQSGGGEGGAGGRQDGGGGEHQGGGGASERKEDRGDGGEGGEEGKGGAAGKRNGDGERGGKREGDGKGNGEKDGDGERERQGGEDEEEEDFDDLTQDEDEEEVMSSASEESVLSVPELQETMEKLTWLASERRLCGEGDSEEDNSPNSPNSPTSPTSPVSQNSQEENSEEEEEGGPPKGEELESGDGGTGKLPGGDVAEGAGAPQASGKGAGRGRGRGRPPPRSLRRTRRQDRDSKDASKLMLLYDDHILDNDPLRESKDIAFAQAYLNRVRDALKDIPGKVEEFLGLLYEFDQGGEGRSAVELFGQLKPVLKEWPELLRDFAAFLLPEQALECGLFAEQQAFERSRRFLRQLEISFGENSSHYQKIVRALQGGPGLSPAGIEELKSQMASLLKGHTHLQGEFWVFFDELRPPPPQPGQFEEAVWPDEGGSMTDGGDGGSVGPAGGAGGGFEEVTLPDLEEEEEVHKIPPMTARNRRRKELVTHGNDKECDWPEKDCSCPCHDSANESKLRRHKRKGCSRCHTTKTSDSAKVMKNRDSLYSGSNSPPQEIQVEKRGEEREEEREGEKGVETEVQAETGVKESSSPRPGGEAQPWEGGPLPPTEERDEEEEEEEWKEGEGEGSPAPKKSRKDGEAAGEFDEPPLLLSGEKEKEMPTGPLQARPSTCSDPPVCAKNISLTPSGEKVILWTREADRVILTACQQQGANQSTFQAVSAQLGNKTANEVSRRFRDLMRLFHTAARQVSSEDEASNTEQQSATNEELD
ncbi:GON-4-like protein isoform X1 [Paramormyrops kingsleyae]|uniref:GON-4-like protein isoform X1 n=1 Tax=Paramormyrops kingsleyae TaxID=1676925 RepID=UPI003B9712F7